MSPHSMDRGPPPCWRADRSRQRGNDRRCWGIPRRPALELSLWLVRAPPRLLSRLCRARDYERLRRTLQLPYCYEGYDEA